MNTQTNDEFYHHYNQLIDVLWELEGVTIEMSSSERWALKERNGDKIEEIEQFIKPFRDEIYYLN